MNRVFRPGQLVYFTRNDNIVAYEKENGSRWFPPVEGSIGLFLGIDMEHESWNERDRRVDVLFGDIICSVLKDALYDVPKYIVNRK